MAVKVPILSIRHTIDTPYRYAPLQENLETAFWDENGVDSNGLQTIKPERNRSDQRHFVQKDALRDSSG